MDCCEVPEPAPKSEPAFGRCRECGGKGRRVSRKTMENLLTPEARLRLRNEPYCFDRSPDCDVVYFSASSCSEFRKGELTVRVGLKETSAPIPLCYCFGHTVESLREELAVKGRTTMPERIEMEIRAGNCRCEVANPSGACCLSEVRRVVGEMERG